MTLQELGELMHKHREEMGLTVEELASQIKISSRYIITIENGSLDGLPHAVYAKGFIRSFANQVGVDQEIVNEAFKNVFPPEHLDDTVAEPRIGLNHNSSTPKFSFLNFVLILLVLAGLGYGGWFVYEKYGDSIASKVNSMFNKFNNSSTNNTTTSSSLNVPNESSNIILAESFVDNSTNNESVVLTENVSSSNNNSYLNKTVIVKAISRCKLVVKKDDSPVVNLSLRPGVTHSIAYNSELTIEVDNAGAISVDFEGRDIGVIGKANEHKVLKFPL